MTAKPLTNGQHPGVLTAPEHGVSKANMACGPARGRSSP